MIKKIIFLCFTGLISIQAAFSMTIVNECSRSISYFINNLPDSHRWPYLLTKGNIASYNQTVWIDHGGGPGPVLMFTANADACMEQIQGVANRDSCIVTVSDTGSNRCPTIAFNLGQDCIP